MFSKKTFTVVGLSLLAVALTAFAQNTRILVQQDGLKVIADERFPKELTCEIYVGPQSHPHFQSEGGDKAIKAARIDVDLGTTVSVLRKETKNESYALYLFFEDAEKKVVGIFDLNIDGQWDVRKAPTRNRNYIFLDNRWQEAEAIEGLLSSKPSAKVGGVHYEFRETWKSVKR